MRELNLIPLEIKRKRELAYKRRIYITITLVVIAIFVVTTLVMQTTAIIYRNRVATLELEIKHKDSVNVESKQLDSQISKYKDYNSKVKELTSSKIIVSDRINELKQFIPEKIFCTTIDYNSEKGIVINGETDEYDLIDKFGAKLQLSGRYKSARIINVNYNENTKTYTFQITITY